MKLSPLLALPTALVLGATAINAQQVGGPVAGPTPPPSGVPVRGAELAVEPAAEPVTAAAEPVKLEGGGATPIEPVQSGAALTAEGAAEVAEMTQAEVPSAPATLKFHVAGGAVYDDNIEQTSTNTEEDFLFLLGAGLTWTPRMTEKSRFSFDYMATGFEYLDRSDIGGDVNHDARVSGRALWGATTVTGDLSYRHFAGAEVSLFGGGALDNLVYSYSSEDRGLRPQENRDLFSASAGLTRPIAGKTALTASINYYTNVYDNDDLASTDSLSGLFGLGYLAGARTTVGVAGVLGRRGGDSGALEEDFQQALLTATYDPTEKLDFSARVGADFRQADFEGGSDVTEFVFNLTARYQWRDRTGFSINADRSPRGSSLYRGGSDLRTSVYVAVDQRIAESWRLQLAGGYELAEYENPSSGYAGVGEEDFLTGRVSLRYQPSERWSASLYYEYRQNEADLERYSYEGNRLGLQVAVSF